MALQEVCLIHFISYSSFVCCRTKWNIFVSRRLVHARVTNSVLVRRCFHRDSCKSDFKIIVFISNVTKNFFPVLCIYTPTRFFFLATPTCTRFDAVYRILASFFKFFRRLYCSNKMEFFPTILRCRTIPVPWLVRYSASCTYTSQW